MLSARRLLFVLMASTWIPACSSSSGSTANASGPTDAAAGNDGSGLGIPSSDGGVQDAAALSDAPASDAAQTPAPDGATADAGGDASSTDITGSSECGALCTKLKATCGSCDPVNDCAIPAGSCAQAERTYIQCEAATGQFSCSSSGWAVVSNCQRDVSVCPPPPVCNRTPPDMACAACLQTQCQSYINVFMAEADYPDFNDCVTQCEMACNDPNACIYGGQFPACGSSGPNSWIDVSNLQACGLRACSNVCMASTVIF
jgi:hypothetical protein